MKKTLMIVLVVFLWACEAKREKAAWKGCNIDSAALWVRDQREVEGLSKDSARSKISGGIGYKQDPLNCIMVQAREFGFSGTSDVSDALLECSKLSSSGSCQDVFRRRGQLAKKIDSLLGAFLPDTSGLCGKRKNVRLLQSVPDSGTVGVSAYQPYINLGMCEDSSWYLRFNTGRYDLGWEKISSATKLPPTKWWVGHP